MLGSRYCGFCGSLSSPLLIHFKLFYLSSQHYQLLGMSQTLCLALKGRGIWNEIWILASLQGFAAYSDRKTMFPNKVNVVVQLLSCVQLFMDYRCQVPLSMGFSRQEYWGGLSFPPPGDLPDPGIKPASPASAGGCFTTEPPGKPNKVNNLG